MSYTRERDTPTSFDISYDGDMPQRHLTDFVVTRDDEKISICQLDNEKARSVPIIARGTVTTNKSTMRVVSRPLVEWCIDYSGDPHLWVRSERVWYRLSKPAKEYTRVHDLARRRFELCARIYILLTTLDARDASFRRIASYLTAPYLDMRPYAENEILAERAFIAAQLNNLAKSNPRVAQAPFLRDLQKADKKMRKKDSIDGPSPSRRASSPRSPPSPRTSSASATANAASSPSPSRNRNSASSPSNSSSAAAAMPPSSTSRNSGANAHSSASGSAPGSNSSTPLSWTPSARLDADAQARLLKRTEKAMNQVFKAKNAYPFRVPVDPERDGCPDYLDRIKRPMDFGTIKKQLDGGKYSDTRAVVVDFDQVVNNCLEYNGESHDFAKWAKELQRKFVNLLRTAEEAEASASAKKAAAAAKKRRASADLPPSGKGVGKKSAAKAARKISIPKSVPQDSAAANPATSNGSSNGITASLTLAGTGTSGAGGSARSSPVHPRSGSASPPGGEDSAMNDAENESGSAPMALTSGQKPCARAATESGGCGRAQAPGSKYCSDECGLIVARKRLAELNVAGFSPDEYVRAFVTKALVHSRS